MRICSLSPSATEIVYAIGLGDQLVGVSYACDYPEEAVNKPVISLRVQSNPHLPSDEIDAIVQQARANGNPLYWIDANLLREIKPDLIITQEVCKVCAIGAGSVFETAAQALDYKPNILTIRPRVLTDVIQNIRMIGAAAGEVARSNRLADSLETRIYRVKEGIPQYGYRPRVLCLDWLDPLRNTGQWVPEMVEMAGGKEGLAIPGGLSRELSWAEIVDYAPEFLMVMPCAFEPDQVVKETSEKLTILPGWNDLPAVGRDQVVLFDGRLPTRHGPRVVDVLEVLAKVIHPQTFRGISTDGVLVHSRN